jgi:signal transduction histidine kinase
MDQAREIATNLVASADGDVAVQVRIMHRNSLGVQTAAIAGSLLVLVLFGGFAWTIARYNRELQRTSAVVEELNRGLEERVEQRTADLKQANDEIQRFAYIVSHDLRAPLVNIMGFTAELDAGLKSLQAFTDTVSAQLPQAVTPEVHHTAMADVPEALDFIRASTTKMDRLINAILKLSREGRRSLSIERVDMTPLLHAILDSVRHQIVDAGVDVRLEGQIPTLISDRVILEQIFSNLIDNAVKYLDPERSGRITISGRVDTGYAVFLVVDNGRGIDPKDYERIFELFRRSGIQNRPGEGIGLAHVRTLVRRLGGDITVSSVLGQGTTFTVRLPRITKNQVET